MKQHFNNGQEYLMVEVPEGARGLRVYQTNNGQLVLYKTKVFNSPGKKIQLPPSQWQILFLASEATEEQAGEVVGSCIEGTDGDSMCDVIGYEYVYKNYETLRFNLTTALESLRSLLVHHGMQGETLFLKRVK